MPKLKMTQNEIDEWMNYKFRGRSNIDDAKQYERLEEKWEMEKVELIMRGAKRLLLKLQS